MSIEDMLLKRLRELPPDRQRDVLAFAESLAHDNGGNKPLRSLEGFLEDLNVDISGEDIAKARREMWGNFPRDVS